MLAVEKSQSISSKRLMPFSSLVELEWSLDKPFSGSTLGWERLLNTLVHQALQFLVRG